MNAVTQIKASFFDDWTKARPYLMSSMHMLDGLYTEDDIIAGVLSGQMRLWVGHKCAAVTNILQFPRGKVMNVVLAGSETGHLQNLLSLGDRYEDYCLENGCRKMRVTGRKGWEKIFPDFSFLCITLTKDI